MDIPDGYSDVPKGKTASVVTHLEMLARPTLRPERSEVSWALRKVDVTDLEWYRSLFRRIGEDWLWFSRLQLSDEELRGVLSEPLRETHVLEADGREEGLVELDFGVEGECDLSFFGLAPALIGCGAGRWMMNRALELAWSRPIRRMSLHTCTLDHPGALAFYVRSGFVPYRRQIEVADDPRATGLLAASAAPWVAMV